MIVHGVTLPDVLDTRGKKPWEVPHVDTMEMWRFAERKGYASLDLLAALFHIPSSKETMHGSEVNTYYHDHGALDKIMAYCREDVVATAQVYRKMMQKPLIAREAVAFVDTD